MGDYKSEIVDKKGYHFFSDLVAAEPSELEELISDVGMKTPQSRRLRERILEAAEPSFRHPHSASANVYQPEPEPELAEVQERPEEEEEEQGTDGVEVTVYSDEARESQTPYPVMTVAALREKWEAGEVDDKTWIWMDHEMFVDADGSPTTDWQPLGRFVDGFGFPPNTKSRAVADFDLPWTTRR
eukprot:COSAG06_NODE_4625_length_4089_cov_101.881203_2_plen_185_part_00